MIIKIFKRFYSITYLKNKPTKNIFIGYQNKDILKKIFKDSIFFDPTILTPFNFKILAHSVWIFFSNLFTEPKKLNFPISQFIFIYFLLAYIKVNKVRKITFLNHYDKIINSILPFLKDTKVYLLEHSLNLTSFKNSKATIFTNCFSLRNEKKEDSKVIELGSLKILYYLEKFNCWDICNEEYQRPKKKEIFYISTLSGYFWNYLKFFKYNSYNDLSNVDHFLNSIDPLKVIKDNNDLLKMRFLDNLMLLGIIKKLENQGYKISVISRNNSNMNKEILSKEKEFYQNNFKNLNFYEFSEEKNINSFLRKEIMYI